MKTKKCFVYSFFLFAFLLAGCGSSNNGTDNAQQPPADTGNANVDAQAVYKNNCLSCHGENLEGRMGGNTNLQKVGARLSKDQIAAQILNGGNGMPAFKGQLTDAEVNALADWLAAKK